MSYKEYLVYTKCCFCIPLRYGLLTWAYMKLISIIILSTVLVKILKEATSNNEAWYIRVLLVLLLVEFCLTFMFVIAGHKKNLRLMRIYYSYCMIMLVVNAVLMMLVLKLITTMFYSQTQTALLLIFKFFCNLVLQCYFILLLRSEIIKLQNLNESNISNNMPETQAGGESTIMSV